MWIVAWTMAVSAVVLSGINEGAANAVTLAFGIAAVAYSGIMIVRNYKWIQQSNVSFVIVVMSADDVVDNLATLAFNSNAILGGLLWGAQGADVNAIHPTIGVLLRLSIYGMSMVAHATLQARAEEDRARDRDRQMQAERIQASVQKGA